MNTRTKVKEVLGRVPLAADLDWVLRHRDGRINSRFRLQALDEATPRLLDDLSHLPTPRDGRKVFFFASSHYWISHTALCGLALRGLGYDVSLGYLPFGYYNAPVNRYDLRLQDLHARSVLERFKAHLTPVPFLGVKPAASLPRALAQAVEVVTAHDTQYTLQREDVSGNESIYKLRAERNTLAARRALTWFQAHPPQVVVVPNGMIQEYGAVYETARYLGIPAVTYEFGEHKRFLWLGQNRLVIHHIIDELWASCKDRRLDPGQRQWLEKFLAGRQGLTTGADFAHLWQKASPQGGAKIRAALGLDERPVLLLPTNVLGDSATLGLTVFSNSMTEWLQRVLVFLAEKPQVQVVVRIHPAETWTVGPSVAEIIRQVLPDLPAHIRLIGSTEQVNTYDLMEIADLALVYTTTAGLEMATRGLPVLVSGRAHYRGKGFTLDADSWEEYFATLGSVLEQRPIPPLTQEQVEQAWNYAYCFFKQYPRPFPWHLENIGPDLQETPLAQVLSDQGRALYESTFRQMAGEAINW
jgi:hypothetical protein